MKRIGVIVCGLALIAGLAAGCRHVHPWQREHMARIDELRECNQKADRYKTHMWSVREGAVGGTGRALGGCGCN